VTIAGFTLSTGFRECFLSSEPATRLRIFLIEFALALGGFAIGTGEFAIMGLMPNVSQDLGVT
jgi:DHA1 family inner membrane transport protein